MNWWLVLTAATMLFSVSFFILFEKSRVSAERVVLIAVLSALSSVGRVLFTALPSVQPSSFIIIVTGIVLGTEAGVMTGIMTALLSGLVMGLGPWTPWQMFAWGLMGLTAGLLKNILARYKGVRVVFGAVWGLLFGWIMNIWMLMTVESIETGMAYVISVYAASLLFDGLHTVANALLLWVGGGVFIKAMTRIATKYGLAETTGRTKMQ